MERKEASPLIHTAVFIGSSRIIDTFSVLIDTIGSIHSLSKGIDTGFDPDKLKEVRLYTARGMKLFMDSMKPVKGETDEEFREGLEALEEAYQEFIKEIEES